MVLPQPGYETRVLQQLLRWLDIETVDAYDVTKSSASLDNGPTKFIPAGYVKHYFTSNLTRVRELIDAVGLEEYVDADHLAANWCRIFCILAQIDKLRFIPTFADYGTLWDRRLPFTEKDPPHDFPRDPTDPKFYEKFQNAQWRFCAWALNSTELNGARIDDHYILPFISRENIGKGGSAKVHKVEVHAEYDKLTGSSTSHHLYAIKTFRKRDAKGNATKEAKAFRQVTDAGHRSTPGLIGFCGSFEYRGTFNIVLQFANGGTLRQFFETKTPPQSGAEVIAFWESLFETIKGVCEIHEQHTRGSIGHASASSNRNILLRGWHQDLKPDNILVINNPSDSGYSWSFRVADLGLCHFETIMSDGTEALAYDAFGTQQYGAPETYAPSEYSQYRATLIDQRVDIWSLGCIFSEACVWIARGSDGVEFFRTMRMDATEKKSRFEGDKSCFHDGTQLLHEVHDFLESLRSDFGQDDMASGRVLEVIETMLQQEPAGRPNARNLEVNTTQLIKRAKIELRKRQPQTPPTQMTSDPEEYLPLTEASPFESSPTPIRSNRSPSSPLPAFTYPQGQVSDAYSFNATQDSTNYNFVGAATQPSMPSPSPSVPSQFQANHGSQNLPGIAAFRPHNQRLEMDPIMSNPTGQVRQYGHATRGPHYPLSPMTAWNAQRGLEPVSSTPSAESPPERVPTATDEKQGSFTYENKVPQCPVEKLEEWYREVRYKNNKAAKLPHHHERGQLEDRDHVFMIDDSQSMDQHWRKVIHLVLHLAKLVKKMDSDGLDLFFLSSPSRYNFKKSSELANKVEQHTTRTWGANLNTCLDKDLGLYAAEIRNPSDRRSHLRRISQIMTPNSPSSQRRAKPRSIYIFTDGILRGGNASQGYPAIQMITEELRRANLSKGQLGIQLISFGNDPDGIARLNRLDQFNAGDVLDIVDTEPSTGNVWKMLLGSINPVYDQVNEPIPVKQTTSFSS